MKKSMGNGRDRVLNYVTGTIKEVREKSLVVEAGYFGLLVNVPQAQRFTKDVSVILHTYLHWNQENGPSLYGFQTLLERQTFLLIIDCPKIGPGIALNILSHFTASQFLECITSQNDKQLSKVNGIGGKKAEQLIVQLKHKVQKMLSAGGIVVEAQESFVQWQSVSEVLNSLNYSKPEITKAMNHLGEKYRDQNGSLDQLIRSALSFLSAKP